ncbi:MAG: hypothetical protein JO076_02500, partial [Verrucomicrobia bacterium]|nr:hypothetical protein [Verrucomicrobiota bacterium]
MNDVPKFFVILLMPVTMGASLFAEGTASPGASVVKAATPITGPIPIPLPDIVAESSAAQNTIQSINAELIADPLKTAVLQDLTNFEHDIDIRSAESARIIANGPSLDVLGELLAIWQSMSNSDSTWIRELTHRATGLNAELARTDTMAETWELTAKEAKNAPQDVFDRVSQTLSLIQQAQNSLKSRRADILSLQSRLAMEETRIQVALNTVQEAKEEAINRLLVRESPPIWALRGNTAQTTRYTFLDEVRRLESFIAQEPAKFLVHIALIFCLFLALRWARRGTREWVKEDPSLQRFVTIFDLPIAASIALSMLFVPAIYHSNLPRLLRAVFGVTALVPAVILLRHLLHRRMFPLLYALIILFFVDEIREITVALPFVTRCLFLLQMLGAIGFILWL